MSKKIAILTDGIYPFVIGGMQKHSFYLCKFLVNLGADVTLVHCVTNGQPVEHDSVLQEMEIDATDRFKSICLKFPAPGKLPGHYLKESYLYSRMVFDNIKDEISEFDFIYAKGFAAWHLLSLKEKGKKFPPISVKFHGYEMFQPPASFRSRLEFMMLRSPVKYNNKNSDYVFSYGGKISKLIREIGIANDRIIDIPTGIEANWIKRTPPTKKQGITKFMFLGRYERRKGIEELNKVIQMLLHEEHEFEFHFVGPIPSSKFIKHEQITYHGKIMEKDKLQEIMDQMQVLVTPSHSEGMPNVIMEGMARGLAVIATDVGAIEMLIDDQNGWLISPNNEQELTHAMLKAMNLTADELVLKQLKSIEKVAENFTWEKVSAQTLKEVEQLTL